MSLPDSPMSAGPPRWAPTHVQVTVLQARGLRSKAKGGRGQGGAGGGSDAYALMALGKEKFATSVCERCLGAPVWREEATFELPARRGPAPAPAAVLQLTVLHRALLGLDKFLGRADIDLAQLQEDAGRRTTRWYKLHSKPGKKAKERGEIEVDIQFMRSNLTASMFDLSMKDKSRNPLGKLKDKLKGKRGSGLPDTASAIIPSISHSPAGSDEESNEKEKKKSKFKTLFSKPGLQKSNVSQSMSVLPTLQPVTEKVRLRPSDFSSQWGDDDDDDDTLTPVSEKPSANRADNNSLYPPSGMSHKRTGSSDSKQLNQIASSSKKDTLSLFGGLKPKNDPASRSNVCINGSHVYVEHSDALSKDSTPSSPSPLTPRQKRLFLSQENLSSETAKEPEVTGQLPAGKGPPESSSLESFKAMTLPSYKLLSGDFLESSTPVTPITLDISKETKENKKQENKKSGLLSLVTGKKEAKVSEETESGADTPLKLKEVKREEKESARKETNPFEVPGEGKRDRGPDKSSAASVPTAKTSSNRFDDVVVGEEKQEKSTAPVKPSQTKPVKPRVGVSSEDETKAALTISEPSCVSPFHPSHLSSNDHNPFTSNLGPEVKALGSDSFRGPSLNLSSPHDNNPFIVKWEQESKVQDSEFFSASPLASGKENNPFSPNWKQESQIENSGSSTKSLLYLPHPPTPVLESHPLPSQLSNVDNPFESKQKEESEHINNPPTPVTFPPPASSQEHDSSAGSLIDSKKCPVIPLEEPQNEGLTNQGPISSLSGSHPEHFCDPVGLLPKMQHDNKDVNIVTPLKENNGSMKKKSVTFAVVESQDHPVSSGDEMSDEDSIERWHDENENVEVSTERNVELELEPEHCSVSRSYDGTISSAANNEGPLEKQAETNSPVKTDPPVPIPRVLMLSPKETGLSGTELNGNSLSVPPKPAPRSTLKQDKCVSPPLTDTAEKDARNSASELGLVVDNSETLANNSSLPTSVLTELHPGQDGGAVESSESSNRDLSVCGISTRSAVLITGDLNLKPATLPVIPEVGSDDEQLSDTQKGVKKTGICEDLSRTSDRSSELWSLVEGRELASNKKATGKQTYSLLARMTDLDDESLESNKALINTLTAGLQNVSRSIGESEPKGEIQEGRQSDCSEASDSPASLSSLSSSALPLVPTSPFQSETLGSDRAEPPKKTAAEGLDAKVEISGKKRLLQAWVSPSEIQPSQALQSGGTQPAKLRLHPVKPMNATTNKPSEKTLNVAKILDSRNEANLKKYNPSDPAYAYAQLTHDELIQLVLKQKEAIAKRDLQVRELEDYIDDLLVRVMEETPNILRVQNRATKKAGKM